MNVGSLLSSLTGIAKTLNDESTTTGEKITAIISVMGMAIPTLMSLSKAFSSVTVSIGAMKLAMWEITLIAIAVAAVIGSIILVCQKIKENSPAEVFKDAAEEADSFKNY